MKLLKESNFQETVKKPGFTLVDFFATWCGPCHHLNPLLEKLDGEYNVTFGKVNVDESSNLAQDYGINAIPTLILFENGTPKKVITGLPTEATLRKMLEVAGKSGLQSADS